MVYVILLIIYDSEGNNTMSQKIYIYCFRIIFLAGGIPLKLYEKRILRNILLPLIAIIVLIGMFYIKCQGRQLQIEFEKLINEEDLNLTIYYMDPFSRTRYRIKDTLILNGGGLIKYKVKIPSSDFKRHIDLLNRINLITLTPVMIKSNQNTRLLYVFETKKGDRILSVSMQGINERMYIKGHEFKVNNFFYEVVMPFLPDDAVEEIQKLIIE